MCLQRILRGKKIIMRAAYIEHVGSIDQIKIGELPVPRIQDDSVLIKVTAVAVNFVDTFVRSGSFKTNLTFPFIIGRDAVGEVVQVGKSIQQFQKGDLVWTNNMGYDGRQGPTSEFALIPEDRLYPIPENIDSIKIVASVHSSATAAILLKNILQVKAGHSILIEGAAGHVGTKLVAIAKALHLNVTTTSNVKDFAKLQKIGVKESFDYHHNIKLIPQNFDYIIDTSGRVNLADNLAKLNLHGQIGLITAPASNRFTFNVRSMYTSDQAVKGFVISHASVEQLSSASQLLNQLFIKGQLLDDSILKLPMSQAAKAQSMLVSKESQGQKIVLTL